MLKRHTKVQLPPYLIMSGLYIIGKYAITPFLFMFRKMGMEPNIARKLDASCNRAVLPLTESSDSKTRVDVVPKITIGEKMPKVRVKYPEGTFGRLDEVAQAPMLLILIRGSWCSYSRLHLLDLMNHKEEFMQLGVQLMAVSSYDDSQKWESMGVDVPMCVDVTGDVFDAFGIKIKSWTEFAWGRILPHESAFLFGDNKKLLAFDVRKVSGIQPGQKFLGSGAWLNIINFKLTNKVIDGE